MEQEKQTQLVEINGVKLEVDMRYARRVDTLRLGTRVKVLKEDYSGPKVYHGIVVGFEPFATLPTIVVAYCEDDWDKAEIKFLFFNEKAKKDKIDIVVAADEDFSFDKDVILARFDKQIAAKRREIEKIEEQKHYFSTNFAAYWQQLTPRADETPPREPAE